MKQHKLSLISFGAMLCVVWWHCFCGSPVERWFIPAVCVWAVPWFFFVSGVLFRRTLDFKSYDMILASKARSLLIPYILWCIIGAFITSAYRIGGVCDAFGFSMVEILPWGNIALWYVRALLIFMVLTMLAHFINRWLFGNARYVALILSFVFIVLTSLYLVRTGPSSSGFYFVIGLAASEKVLQYNGINKRRSALLGASFLFSAVILRLMWFRIGYDYNHSGGTLLANASVLLLCIAIWYLTDFVPYRLANHRIVMNFLPLTAFVYFMHYPVNDFIKHHVMHIQNRDILFVSLCVCAPLLYLLVAWMVRKYLNRVYTVLSGGR